MLALYHVNHSTVHAAIIELSSCKLLTVEYLVASPSLAGLTLHYNINFPRPWSSRHASVPEVIHFLLRSLAHVYCSAPPPHFSLGK